MGERLKGGQSSMKPTLMKVIEGMSVGCSQAEARIILNAWLVTIQALKAANATEALRKAKIKQILWMWSGVPVRTALHAWHKRVLETKQETKQDQLAEKLHLEHLRTRRRERSDACLRYLIAMTSPEADMFRKILLAA